MAEDAGTIFYEVDAKTDKVIDAGKRAVDTLDVLTDAFDKTDRAADRSTKAMDRSSTSMGKASKATTDEANALGRLLGQIDPVLAATRRLDSMQDQLSAAFANGRISAEQYRTYLAKLDAQYAKLENSGKKTQQSTEKFGSSLKPLTAAIAGVITVQTLKQWGMLAEQFTLLEARVTRLSPSLSQAATNYQALLGIAAATGQTVPATVKLWESLTASLKTLGATNEQVLTLTDTLQKIGKIGGSSAEETANALRQLGQSLAGGTLRAEEYNSIVEQTPELIRQLASASKMSMGQFRQAMLDGKITSEQLFDLLITRTAQVDEEFKKIPRSASDAGNAVTVAFGAALSKLDQATGASKALANAMDALANNINKISGNLSPMEKLNSLLEDQADVTRMINAQNDKFFGPNTARLSQLMQMQAKLNDEIAITRKGLAASTPTVGGPAPKRAEKTDTTEGQKVIQQLAEQNALARAQGEERAKLVALQKLGLTATQQERDLAVALAIDTYRLTEAEKTRQKAKKTGITEAAKLERQAESERKKAEKEKLTGNEKDQAQFAKLGQEIANIGQTAREVAQDTAQLSLSKFASADEVQRIRDMAGALYDLRGAKQALAAADPIAAQQQSYDAQLKQLQTLNDQKLLSDQRYLELKHQAETANTEQMRILQEENFKAASLGNELLLNSIDALGQSATSAISGILSGTGSLQDALGGIANTVLNTVIGTFVQMGVEWIKQQIMMQAAAQTTTAVQTAGIGTVAATQATATTAIAATTTTAAATTGTAVATSMAPAAGLSSIASFGGAAVIGGAALLATMLLAKSFGGGRRAGGSVNANSVYRVNEGGAPEVFNAGGQQYMIPNQRGEVVSNKNATADNGSGTGAAPIINIYEAPAGTSVTSSFNETDRRWVVDVVAGDMATGGKTGKTVNAITGTQRAGS